MGEAKKPLLDFKRTSILLALIFITALLTGGGVWLFMNQYEISYNKTNETEVKIMQARIDSLHKNLNEAAKESNSASLTQASAENSTSSSGL